MMKTKTILALLACVGLAAASQAAQVTFDFQEYGHNVDLGTSKTFHSGGVSLTALSSPGHDLFAKWTLGDPTETGLGLTGTGGDHEITGSTYVALQLPTSPVSDLQLVLLGSVQSGEVARIYYSTTLGDTSAGALIGTVTHNGTFDVSGLDTSVAGYIMITGGGTGGANVLLDSVTAIVNVPDGGLTVAMLGGALTALGFIRRKLVA